MMDARKLPLEGLKIVELGHYIAAPFATRLLADLGAEVVKVEPPDGDPVRGWGSSVDGHAVWFSVHGRNKLSVTLDLKKPADREKLLALLVRADALVENFRAGYLERIGLGPDVLHAANPRLVIGRISGYGQEGPYRDKPAFGAIGEAMGGLRHLTANPGQTEYPPPRCGVSISDDLAGMYCAMAVVAACWQVKGDPAAKGRVVDVDLVSSVFSLMEGMLPEYGLFGWVRQPQGAAIKTAAPTNTYPCADGKWLCIAGNSDLIFKASPRWPRTYASRITAGGARTWRSSMPPSPTGRAGTTPRPPRRCWKPPRCRARACSTWPIARPTRISASAAG